MSPKLIFTTEDDTSLANHISKYPCIFDSKHDLYKNQTARENIWKEISEDLQKPAKDCKSRWRNMRDTYLKRKRLRKTSKWALSDALSFLDDTLSFERESTNTPTLLEELEYKEEVCSPIVQLDSNISNSTRKRKLDPLIKVELADENLIELPHKRNQEMSMVMMEDLNKTDEDPIDVFFKTMALTVKQFSRNLQVKAKMDVMRVISKIELENHALIHSNIGNNHSNFSISDSD